MERYQYENDFYIPKGLTQDIRMGIIARVRNSPFVVREGLKIYPDLNLKTNSFDIIDELELAVINTDPTETTLPVVLALLTRTDSDTRIKHSLIYELKDYSWRKFYISYDESGNVDTIDSDGRASHIRIHRDADSDSLFSDYSVERVDPNLLSLLRPTLSEIDELAKIIFTLE